jgi:uncharacterized lipoprotein YddW (UPF0748 family)
MKKRLARLTFAAAWCGVLILAGACARYKYYTPPAPPPQGSQPVHSTPPTPRVAKPPAEIRAVWVSDTPSLDWSRATASLQETGFNTMYVNLATAGAAFYPGSHVLTSAATVSREEFASNIELARRRGLAVHAKIIVLFMFKTPASIQQQLAQSGRVMCGPGGPPIVQAGSMWLCPSNANNRARMIRVLEEMLSLYQVDGIQYDYIRFSEEPSCYCSTCKNEFERSTGAQITGWPQAVYGGTQTLRYREWQRQLINDWCRSLTLAARRINPRLIVSAAVFSDLERARAEKSQDWQWWLQQGLVDYVCTMTYTTTTTDFEALIRKQRTWAPRRDQLVIGIGSWKMEQMSQLTGQIEIVRREGLNGFALFSYDDAAKRQFLPLLRTN